jgi:hypothetical protein
MTPRPTDEVERIAELSERDRDGDPLSLDG